MLHKPLLRFLLFLAANFSALYIGVILMQHGPKTAWYLSLKKAPWTPPNWMFGVAWTTIMLCFSLYMTQLSYKVQLFDKNLLSIYTIQWILNIGWNFVFFYKHHEFAGLLVIVLLWLLIGYFTFQYYKKLYGYTLFIVPYLLWMTIAVSLNAYIVLNN